MKLILEVCLCTSFFLLTLKSSLVRINFSYRQSFLKVHLPIHLIHTIIERKLLSQGKNPAKEFLLIQVKVCEVCEKDKVRSKAFKIVSS